MPFMSRAAFPGSIRWQQTEKHCCAINRTYRFLLSQDVTLVKTENADRLPRPQLFNFSISALCIVACRQGGVSSFTALGCNRGLELNWLGSCTCSPGLKRSGGPARPADRGFTGDPTSLACDSILQHSLTGHLWLAYCCGQPSVLISSILHMGNLVWKASQILLSHSEHRKGQASFGTTLFCQQ